MAHMMPLEAYSGTRSSGELTIFDKLKYDSETTDWIVLHSLDIAHHVKRVSGEADFVVVVPGYGVLCLEVKASTQIKRENSVWYYGNNHEPDRRGPFRQADEAMHSLRRTVSMKQPQLANVLFWSAVVFPFIEFRTSSDEWHSWQVIDRELLNQQPISKTIVSILRKAREHLINHGARSYTSDIELSNKQCKQIAEILRPDFEFFTPMHLKKSTIEAEIKKYTEEQFQALDAMNTNDRVIFSGPAGTGKTFLALEAARRAYYLEKKTLFLCYNRLLGKKLFDEASPIIQGVTVSTIHKHMLSVANIVPPSQASPSFWVEDLPNLAIEKLLQDTTDQYIYSELILDEAQDLFNKKYLDFIDLSLKGGLRRGRWRIFGDFERQAIYETSTDVTLDEAITTRLGQSTVYELRINCRNTPRVASLVQILAKLQPGYSRILRPDNQIEPKIRTYKNLFEQLKYLTETLNDLLGQGYSPEDIVILSPKNTLPNILHKITEPLKSRLRSFDNADEKHIRYGTIYAFKGLESPAVIVTDIESLSTEKSRSIFYVAMTRALHSLTLIVSNSVRDEILTTLTQNR